MNSVTHPIAPEEVMALLDGELSQFDAQAVSAHLEDCVECASLAERLRATSQSLSEWIVPPVPSSLEESVLIHAAKTTHSPLPAMAGRSIQLSFWNWRLWAVGAGGAVTVVLVLVAIAASMIYHEDHSRHASLAMNEMVTNQDAAGNAKPQSAAGQSFEEDKQSAGFAAGHLQQMGGAGGAGIASIGALAVPAPMIARTVSLTIVVKDFAATRTLLDSIVARHHGYAAQLTAATAENAPPSLQASLRIPAPELAAAIDELKALGRVQNESQSGEEVTQQHTDLAARLKNSRETEERLRAILEQRTGKIEDVLQVEEEIARVRGEIESIEAEQQVLEHRVEFVSVDLQLTEEYTAQLNPPSGSVSNRLHNAFVTGLRNAAETVLGLVLLLEEYGPALLIWLAILGLPILLLGRRYRKLRAKH
ncbi:MAG: DUF4349 domain-containing protein [Terracidiphilus sp.]|jgi:anti-sigma factor RsiW